MRKAWNKISRVYQDRYNIKTGKIHYGPLCPSENSLNLLGPLKGKKVLELGSGACQNSIVMALSGACVTSWDISREQLKHGAKIAKDSGATIKTVEGSFLDFAKMDIIENFDLVLSVFALQYCRDKKELDIVFKSVYNALTYGGSFVFSLDHPIRSHGSWQNNYFVFDNYFDKSQKKWKYDFPESEVSVSMSGSYLIIQDYFDALTKNGFYVKQLLEPEPVKSDFNSNFGVKSRYGIKSKDDPFEYNNLSRVPGTIIFQSFKLPRENS